MTTQERTARPKRAMEQKWQTRWETDRLYRSTVDWNRPKHYALTMLPYPSGDLHMGHWFAMTPSDTRARYMRMKGFNVLFPMGFDAFGLPAENAAVQRGIHPARWTFGNIERMRGQLRSMGAMFDWEREAVSCEPGYYKWTEWFFKKFYEAGLAYRGEAMVNWSPTLQTVLANEQVIDGKDERTGQPVIQKMMTQWFFRITRYADELLSFTGLDWPEPIRTMQTNWIGRSEGARVIFHTEEGDPIEIFTTRPDTLWGATFMVLSPEHPLVARITGEAQREEVEDYVKTAARKSELDRTSEEQEKTGVFTGGYAINPVNQERIPIWIADYVLISYGTGAIMAVPAHDERDFAFARAYGLEIRPVIQPDDAPEGFCETEAYSGAGRMVNSGRFDGAVSNGEKGRRNPAISAVIDWLGEQRIGKEAINYRLRDWLISRQRYWGSPIPMIYTEEGKVLPVADSDLPVVLPEDVQMTGVGNPLRQHEGFVNTTAPDGRPALRETDTMDTFMCSSWYWYRYLSPQETAQPFSPEEAAYWLPVDVYTGGAEHATMHLLYARFFAKAMRDIGAFDATMAAMQAHKRDPEVLTTGEPMLMLRNQGQILGEERSGHFVRARGRWDGANKLFATEVEVIDPAEVANGDPMAVVTSGFPTAEDASSGVVTGEIMKRTENLLTVASPSGDLKTIEVIAGARVIIPDIPGENTVNQLKHHLEIQRMSKSKGNVVNPDELVDLYGADTVRAYLMFGFDWEKGGPWNSQNIQGVVRWLDDVWEMIVNVEVTGAGDPAVERQIERRVHQTIKSVGDKLEAFNFNKAIAELMTLKNDLRAAVRAAKISHGVFHEAAKNMLLMMAPFTPHIAEELWVYIGEAYSIHQQAYPTVDPAKAAEETTTLVVMKNGKPIDRVEVAVGIGEEDAKAAALASAGAQRALGGGAPRRVVFIPGRGDQNVEPKVNIVV
ncbi:MAG: leucine--tRNA ligase [Anaerolineae bacterium]|nr:leucine--tRNA ligase [Anaerolineae bacterium]NUQ04589.1 leucine--tRNA ligase [Anaerolineae bacterium]